MKKKSYYVHKEASINNKVYILKEKIKELEDDIDESNDITQDFNKALFLDILIKQMVKLIIGYIYINYKDNMIVIGDLTI